MTHSDKLKAKIADLPVAAGVYIFKDAEGQILYIGKAKSLKKRVQSYFSRPLDFKTQVMVSKVRDIEYRLTSSEAQAQILEAALIKDKKPQYNIDLKDDKSFPWIRITHEEFPVVSIFRRKKARADDRSLYFGPYPNVKLLRKAIKLIRRIFGFRSCKKLPQQACLYSRLNLCPAPCIAKISKDKYKEIINQIRMFLESQYEELLNELSQKMKEASGKQRFEEATKIRDQINALSTIAHDSQAKRDIDELKDLKKMLRLDKIPLRIEAFDISNISGKEATGAMVSFYRGIADKNNYRRFRIKTIETIDDYGMLREVISRRYSRSIKENLALPDLIVIDGGRSHLSVAAEEIKRLGLEISLVSIAKEQENIYTNDKASPIKLNADRPALNLMRRIRDEAHRFAVAYHHILRRKKLLVSKN